MVNHFHAVMRQWASTFQSSTSLSREHGYLLLLFALIFGLVIGIVRSSMGGAFFNRYGMVCNFYVDRFKGDLFKITIKQK